MNLSITNITFKGQTHNKNSLAERIRRFNSCGNLVAVPVDEGNPLTAPRYGLAYPTPFEDCFEKMSFEEDEDNMWRDAQYIDEYIPPKGYPQQSLSNHIIAESPNITIDYSIDDVPVSTSNYRRRVGLNDLADVNATIDTDMTNRGKRVLNKINYFENIVPQALKYTTNIDFVVFDDFSSWASIYEEDGYPRSGIIRAMEKSCLKDRKGNKRAEVELFKILVEYPNIRPLVVTKCGNNEIFDKTTANYYRTLHRHYFNDEKEIKKALNLCKIDDNGTLRGSQELCEIVTLLRRKSAQNLEAQELRYGDIDNESTYQRNKKYVDKATPLTENDIELLQKLKKDDKLNEHMSHVVKTLLKEKNLTVAFILDNIDSLLEDDRALFKVMQGE